MANDEDDPADIEKWVSEHRANVARYLRNEAIAHGRIADEPIWDVLPHLSIWSVEAAGRPRHILLWVICGDVPTDYVEGEGLEHARDILRAFATRWLELAQYMARGEAHPAIQIGKPETWPTLAPLLEARGEMLLEWANDESLWAH